MSNQVRTLHVKDLCNNDKYIVPIYQRNYAWGKDEIELLIQDIEEAQRKAESKNYYIGSLVVAKRIDGYEVIDGQQRLTTLKLLLSYYNQQQEYKEQKHINLTFEHREESNHTLSNLTNNLKESNNIILGYQIIDNILKQKSSQSDNKLDFDKFFNFLLNKVVILRAEVPEGTDLNHYFEIMNNRGEQLEKHEVLKARLMNKLPKSNTNNERALFSLIWDACSDMNVYAIKRFPYSNDNNKSIRTSDKFFGMFCHKIPSSFEEMLSELNLEDHNGSSSAILELLSTYKIENKKESNNQDYDEIKDGRFNSIIDFPNFLMIALRIFISTAESEKDIPLNDKFLLDVFDKNLLEDQVRDFIVCLLKCRLVFDRYIIKSRDDEDSWTLNGLKKYKNGKYFYFKEVNTFGKAFEFNDDKQEVVDEGINYDTTEEHIKIVQILSMFHTAFRQKTYKDWLYEVVNYLYNSSSLEKNYDLKANDYVLFLENLANKFYQKQDRQALLNQGEGTITYYIFNYLDYLLWKDWDSYSKDNKFLKRDNFVFSLSRNSVEHYLAQSKKDSLLDSITNKDERNKILNNFGNLCLISQYQNSSLNNEVPSEKVKRYLSGSLRCISPKQALMLSYSEWGEKQIIEHGERMRDILEG